MFLGLGANCFKEPVTQLFSLFFTSLISLFSSYVFLVTLLFIIFFNRYCINFIIIVFVFVGKSFFCHWSCHHIIYQNGKLIFINLKKNL